MEMLKYEQDLVAAGWESILEALDFSTWEPSSEDVRKALNDVIVHYSNGNLTESEFKWVVAVLASQFLEMELQKVFESFGRGLGEDPAFARRSFNSYAFRNPVGASRVR